MEENYFDVDIVSRERRENLSAPDVPVGAARVSVAGAGKSPVQKKEGGKKCVCVLGGGGGDGGLS